MTDLTPKEVISDIRPFSNFSEDHVNQEIATAKLQAESDQLQNTKAYKQAVIAYTRHLLLIDKFEANGGVTNASVMGNSQAVANPENYSNGDQYLQTYNRLADNYGNPVGQGRVFTMNGLGSNDLY